MFLRVLDQFDALPGHLTEDLHLFSLNDLTAVRNGELAPRMKELLKLGTVHVTSCVVSLITISPSLLLRHVKRSVTAIKHFERRDQSHQSSQ